MGINVFPLPSSGLTQNFSEFTSTGTFTTPSNVTVVEVLLVAGGGGGGSNSGGNALGGGGGWGDISDRNRLRHKVALVQS